MSILETFYILFKSDASDVKRGAEEAEKSTKRLNDRLSSTGKASEKVGGAFLGMARAFTGVIAAAVSVSTVIGGIKAAADYSIELGNISRQLGVNVETLDAWGNAVKRTGGTAQGFQQSLRSLSEHLGGSPALALKVLPQLADVFSRLGRVQSLRYGKMLGLDESTILMLQHGRREVEEMIRRQKELGVVTKQDAEISRKFNVELQDTEIAFRRIYLELASSILPYLTKFLDLIRPGILYLREHIGLVKGALIGIGLVATAFLIPFIAANAVIIGITAGIAGLIALFALAYEDIQYFLEGNESLIGDILKKWPLVGSVVGAAVKSIVWLLKEMNAGLEFGFNLLKNILFLFSDQNIMAAVKYLFGGETLSNNISKGQNLLGVAGSSALNSQTSNSIFGSQAFNRNNAINTGPITIQTQATDATGIMAGLNKGLNEHLWQANSFFDDGVVA